MSRSGRSIVPCNLTKLDVDNDNVWGVAGNSLDTIGAGFEAMTCFSIYEMYQRMDEVAYQGQADFVLLKENYWDWTDKSKPIQDGKVDIIVPLPANPTWIDIWKAADKAIKESTDHHHVFVEDVQLITYNGKPYITVACGS